MTKQILLLLLLFIIGPTTLAANLHEISFRWPNLYPESFTFDPISDHFIVGSLRLHKLISVSDAGVASSLLKSTALPSNSSFLGLALDPRSQRRRLLAVVHRAYPRFNALVAYDLPSFRQLFLTPLDGVVSSPAVVNDVAADFSGNAYVTDSANDLIYKIDEDGVASVLSSSSILKSTPVDSGAFYRDCGLNGVLYNSKGYLLVTQSNTGSIFKVNVDDGTARQVHLNRDLTAVDGMALRRDGVVLVVSRYKLYFIKSRDGWSEGVVFDETALDEDGQASAVAVGRGERAYVLYGHVQEGVTGNSERERFGIVEVESKRESDGESVWIFVLIGLGLAYFLLWRFQMRHLVNSMSKKTA